MNNSKYNKDKKSRRIPVAKIVVMLVALIIAGFYLVSALGWLVATYAMARTGELGNELMKFYQNLNVADHIIRSAQVILIVVASIALLLFRNMARILILISIIFSLVSSFLIDKWAISFLGWPSGLLILVIVYIYAYFLKRQGFLH
ncbi:MAG: hypothetical protein ACYC69_18310 [Thermodesulfovibrionales bacterium]